MKYIFVSNSIINISTRRTLMCSERNAETNLRGFFLLSGKINYIKTTGVQDRVYVDLLKKGL